MLHRFAIVLTFALLLFNCTNDSIEKAPTIYIGGFEQRVEKSGTLSLAKYWRNGQEFTVTDGSKFVFINGMTVVGNDLYLVGYERTIGTSINTAKYWKNGVGVPLSNGSISAKATCIAVSGSDVHVAGYEVNGSAKYWKNGVEVPLESAVLYGSQITAITVSDGNAYLAGRSDNGGAYWKNGSLVKEFVNESYGYFTAIAVSGNDIYLAGTTSLYDAINGFVSNATYWKNGNPTKLTWSSFNSNGTHSWANSLVVVGSDVYVGGYYYEGVQMGNTTITTQKACFWKNNQPVDLWSNGSISSMAVNGNDVYTIGDKDAETIYSKNGTISPILAPNDSTYESAVSIVLVR